ncbi:endonuclease/exonuclease/phosphatase family protein [Actinoplanes sp. GCM10030250]|uniref:endonuclease/exonuclease/phosphatase family protein n=1 Tax=Actinoplanes sp. GCM10030250 TaxID=3273376 RepID=UPI0036084075
MSRWLTMVAASVAGLVLAAVLVPVVATAPKTITGAAFRVVTFNVCGGNAAGRLNADPPQGCMYRPLDLADSEAWAARLKAQILTGGAREPDAVMFQEMCATQRELVAKELPGYAVAWLPFRTNHYACPEWDERVRDASDPAGREFGTAIFFRGGITEGPLTTALPVVVQESDTRGLLCAASPIGGREALVCTVHNATTLLDEGAPQTAGQIEQWARGRPVILGGDFNAGPEDSHLGVFYGIDGGTGSFAEVDQADREHFPERCEGRLTCRAGASTVTGGNDKKDYLFGTASQLVWTDGEAVDPVGLTRIPDHRALIGDAAWRVTAHP